MVTVRNPIQLGIKELFSFGTEYFKAKNYDYLNVLGLKV